MELDIVVMAAGKGTRMRSDLPKVLHPLLGKPMVQHVLETASMMAPERITCVIGYRGELVEEHVRSIAPTNPMVFVRSQFVKQEPQLGTGHAVQKTVPFLGKKIGTTIVLNGDVPLISVSTLQKLYTASYGKYLTLVTTYVADPTGYGRIIRENGRIVGIVEHKDCTPEQLSITEVYTGMLAAPTELLKEWVGRLTDDNAQKEFYLTDIVKFAVKDGVQVMGVQPAHAIEVLGVNSPEQLAALEEMATRTSYAVK